MEKKTYLVLGAAALGSAGAGFFGGYKWAMKKFYRSYEEVLAMEIKKTQEFYASLHKQDFATPGEAVDALVPDQKLEDATMALRKYASSTLTIDGAEVEVGDFVDLSQPVVEVEVEHRNVFDLQTDTEMGPRDESKPYLVTFDEYMEHPEGHDEIQLTYYAGDGILGDDQDEPVENVEQLVGRENLNFFGLSDPDDPHILLIRNHPKKLDIEITLSDGKFAHEVAGFNHSDEPVMRRRPRWDDD